MSAVVVMSIWGHVVITKKDGLLECFTGVGSIGFRKRAQWSSIKQVREEPVGRKDHGVQQWRLVLEGDERVTFASGLSTEHRSFVRQKLNALLGKRR